MAWNKMIKPQPIEKERRMEVCLIHLTEEMGFTPGVVPLLPIVDGKVDSINQEDLPQFF